MITPFSVNVPQSMLDDLKTRLSRTRWPDELTGSQWHYGTSLAFMRELTRYWQHEFNWRDVEKEINAYPNFVADIDGHRIHFIQVKGEAKRSLPLLITHGWPGSFLEMLKLIPLLTQHPDFSFDLIIPSIPGFGFSSKPTELGCNSELVADLWHKLMSKLGYPRYGAQGGDIGAGVSTWLALKYPQSVIGLHLNYIPGSYRPYLKPGEPLSEEELAFQNLAADWFNREGAYAHLHATKPLTAAYALTDSPAGLCAWIVEKFNSWSDNRGNLEHTFSKHQLLANITLYWLTESVHSSMRIYHENREHPLAFGEQSFVSVPVGFAQFPHELPTPPRAYIEKGFNICHWTTMPVGGHFAAMEQPERLSRDLIDFFSPLASEHMALESRFSGD